MGALSPEVDRNKELSTLEKVLGIIAVIAMLGGAVVVSLIFAGCANSPSGVKITASSATYTNIGDINWDEYKIPILSIYLGPRATVWVNKNYKALDSIELVGCVTNKTEALAIYDSTEQKTLTMRVRFNGGAETNTISTINK